MSDLAGTMTLEADDWTRFRRFLCLGRESALYSSEDDELSRKSAIALMNLLRDGHGVKVVAEIQKFCEEGRVAKNKPAIFALAVCAKDKDFANLEVRQAAYAALTNVCKIPTHLFQFMFYCKAMAMEGNINDPRKAPIGWGRSTRNAVKRWYSNKDPLTLAMHVTKYIQRHAWSHRDLMRLCHIKPKTPGLGFVLLYAAKGYDVMMTAEKEAAEKAAKEAAEKEAAEKGAGKKVEKVEKSAEELAKEKALIEEGEKVLEYLKDVHELKHLKIEDKQRAAHLIRKHDFVREHVPTWMHSSDEVWTALLESMPITAMVRNLGKMSTLNNMMAKDSLAAKMVVEKLQNSEHIRKSKIHPLALLVGLETYKSEKGDKGKLKWKKNDDIVIALENAWKESLKSLEETKKKYLLGVDVSAGMNFGKTNGMHSLKTSMASAAIILMFHQAEKEFPPKLLAFTPSIDGVIEEVPIVVNEDKPDISTIRKRLDNLSSADMDPAEMIKWAEAKKEDVDVFVALTDLAPHLGSVTPKQAIDSYRKTMNKPDAKFIAVALAASSYQVADPDDPGMLDVAGFDSNAPIVINNFVNGLI